MSVNTFTKARISSASSLSSLASNNQEGLDDKTLSASKTNSAATNIHTIHQKSSSKSKSFSKRTVDESSSLLKFTKIPSTNETSVSVFKNLSKGLSFWMVLSPIILLVATLLTTLPTSFDRSSLIYWNKVQSFWSEVLQNVDKKHSELNYVAIIDAGSTGSRIHVYQFDTTSSTVTTTATNNINTSQSLDDDQNAIPIPKLVHETFDLIRPGLSHQPFVQNFTLGAQSLEPLIEIALSAIPKHLQATTPLSIKATAGLRLIGENKTADYLSYIRQYLEAKYPFDIKSVEIMDGKDEAVYAWLTTNYLLGNLDSPDHGDDIDHQDVKHEQKSNSVHKHTAAVFDLGGASTQIVFEPHSSIYTDEMMDQIVDAGHGDHIYDLALGVHKYRLYQHSHLGYGLMETRKKIHRAVFKRFVQAGLTANDGENSMLEQAFDEEKNMLVITNPCVSTDMERVIEVPVREVLEEVLGEFPSHQQNKFHISLMNIFENSGEEEEEGEGVTKVVMRGPKVPVSIDQCLDISIEILNLDAKCSFYPCSFNGVHQPDIMESFGPKPLNVQKHGFEQVFQEEQEEQAHVSAAPAQSKRRLNARSADDNTDADADNTNNIDSDDTQHSFGVNPPLYIFSYFYDRTFPLGLPPVFELLEFTNLLSSICLGPRSWDPSHPSHTDSSSSSSTSTSTSSSIPNFSNLSTETIQELSDRPEWCLDLATMYAMLRHGYKIPDEREVTIAKQIDGHELGWCLGAAIGILGGLEEE